MYEKAQKYLESHVTEVHTYEELKDVIEGGKGYAKMMWCGDEECEVAIKDRLNASSRCMPFDQNHLMIHAQFVVKKQRKLFYLLEHIN